MSARATARDVRIAAQRAGRLQRFQQPSTHTLPAPIGGLNGRDALDDMKPEDALQMDNMFPGFGKVEVRGGTSLWGTVGGEDGGDFVAETDPVETLIGIRLSTGNKMLAAAGGSIYDVTSGGEQGTALATSFSNDRWQHAVMNDVVGLVNGEDEPQTYDGSSVGQMTVDEADGESATLTSTALIGINVYKSRSYFWEANSAGFWFSAVNTLGGDLNFFPLGDVQGVGGYLVAMVSWTRDGGEGGVEDLAVFLMSSGQAVIYAGSDPGDAEDWAHRGTFSIGAPIGSRCVQQIGGEAVILTVDGYTMLSRVLPGGRVARDVNVSDKLGKFALDAIRINGSNFGWQPVYYPRGKRLLVNHPVGSGFQQHVVNLVTGAWGLFRDGDHAEARCWTTFGDRLFFGADAGRIIEADTGTSDRGAMISAVGQNAFCCPGRGRNIHVNAVRPLLEATGELDAKIDIYADYSPTSYSTVEATFGAVGGVGAEWNEAEWNEADWATSSRTVQGWIGHAAHGYAISPAVRIEQSNDRVAWSGTALMFTPAGII